MNEKHTYKYQVKSGEHGVLTTNMPMDEFSKLQMFPNMYKLKKCFEDGGYSLKFETINKLAPNMTLTDLDGSVE